LPEPLGVLIRKSRTIHVLRVEKSDPEGVTFKATAALKGKLDEAPFLELLTNVKQDLFQVGDTALCFCRGDVARRDGDAVGLLHVKGRWFVAASPVGGEKNWFSTGEHDHSLTYVGSTEGLREAVSTILAGRETTITARAPVSWNARGIGRLWRIKAGPTVTGFVLSDGSPHFVGWGTVDPAEAAKLVRALRKGVARKRVVAAEDLAHLGAARAVVPALRDALKDSDNSVRLAAANALVRLCPADRDGLATVLGLLGSADPEARCAALNTLSELGPLAGAALPRMVKALTDNREEVRATAADAVGRVAQGSPSTATAVAALAALFKETRENDQAHWFAVCALRCLGPQSWEALPELRKLLLAPGWSYPDDESMGLLARFDPPLVETLAELLPSRSPMHLGQPAAARELGALGARARIVLPVLRRVLLDPTQRQEDSSRRSICLDTARALLDIDPKGSVALTTPVLLELTRERSTSSPWPVILLARCGKGAKASLPTLLARLDPNDTWTPEAVRKLSAFLGPEHRELLPKLRRLLASDADGIDLAVVLYRLGEKEKALAHATFCVEKNKWPNDRVAAARWLGERGREARAAEPAVRRALAKATGAERARLALTLWRLRGALGTEVQRRALDGLANLLRACEGVGPAGIGRYEVSTFWRNEGVGWEESEAVGAAIATVHDRLLGKDDTVAVLARGLRECDPYVRLAAAVALAKTRPDHPGTVPAMRKLLERHPHFFCFAADTLAALGPTAAPLALLVQPLLRHPDGGVHRAAARVLRRLDPQLAAMGWGATGAGAVPRDLVPLWDDLAADDALRADLAVWRLAGAGPRAVTLVRERLRPPPTLPAERIARTIADLDSDDYNTRQRARTDLARGIESATPALRRALDAKPSAEVRQSINRLLDGDLARDPEYRRRLRAVRLLQEVGGADARTLLERLSRGDDRFALTHEAAAALRYLDRP
jgi:hypothetical protein